MKCDLCTPFTGGTPRAARGDGPFAGFSAPCDHHDGSLNLTEECTGLLPSPLLPSIKTHLTHRCS